MNLPLPSKFLGTINRQFPGAWRMADVTRSIKGRQLADWDNAVFIPFSGWCSIFMASTGEQLGVESAYLIPRLACAGAWRPAQDIVRFEPELAASLTATELSGNMPSQLLWRLPTWCIYVDEPVEVAARQYDGFFAFLEHEPDTGLRELRLHFLRERDDLALAIQIGPWSLEDGLERMVSEACRGAGLERDALGDVDFLTGVSKAANLVLYLCAYGLNEIKRAPDALASYPGPKRVKGGWRLFPPDKPTLHMLGGRLASAIRREVGGGMQASRSGSHASPRPHIRRAHWHGFWTGRKGCQVFDLRWLPPIPVAMGEDDD